MIKKIAYIWLLAAIGIMAACTEDTFVDNRTKVDDDHLLVTFRTHVPEMAQVTTRTLMDWVFSNSLCFVLIRQEILSHA